ncbi:hypothetical protein WH95_01920 [Kiloniella litopenaei]|uniref:PAS fold-4 domain-containing protein n=1 Tax=Kiloniella litopenaei TaxID=1549748 RepID=A0A0M2REY3_9PROT|nr:hypothetical protein [Kiloniella litopenaei]KKJ78133.1 hypothetical protein WH95_01920 [Kiloniella litopenaei]
MLEIGRDLEISINHPAIKGFLNLCDQARGKRQMSLDLIQSRPFVPYWSTLIVNRWHEDKQDFLYSFWGSKLSSIYGMDLTGKYILRGEFKSTEKVFWNAHKDVITDLNPVYLNTSIHWLNKEHQSFNAVIIPMERNDKITETIAYIAFDN